MVEKILKNHNEPSQKDKALLFDLDGVLIYSRARNIAFYTHVYDRAATYFDEPNLRSPSVEDILSCFALGLEDAIEVLTPPAHKDKVSKIIDLALDKDTHRFSDMLDGPPHLEESLGGLHELYDLGIVTNAPRDSVAEFFEKNPNSIDFFDAVIDGDNGYKQKPDPEPIYEALKILGKKTKNAALAGDTILTDGGAARQAGIQFIHVAKYEEPDPEADLVVANLYDLYLALGGVSLNKTLFVHKS